MSKVDYRNKVLLHTYNILIIIAKFQDFDGFWTVILSILHLN